MNNSKTRLLRIAQQAALLTMLSAFAGSAMAQDIGGRVSQSGALRNVAIGQCANLTESNSREGVAIVPGDCRSDRGEWDLVEVGRNDFVFVNRMTGQVMDVQGGSRDDGVRVQQWSWNRSGAQRWSVDSTRNGLRVINKQSGKCLEMQGRGNGGIVVQNRCSGNDSQLWRMELIAGGGRPNRPPESRPDNSVGDRPNGRVLYVGIIHSRVTGKCADVADASQDDGADIRQWSCNGSKAQAWEAVDVGRNEIVFISTGSGKVMDVVGNPRRTGADVVQNRWNGAASQRWRVENTDAGFVRIVNAGSRKCLDLEGSRPQDGTNISQFDCHNGGNQQWRIEVRGRR
ncbi:MAG: RICIN domain-containing protein [Betaproteobacteria bacterium]